MPEKKDHRKKVSRLDESADNEKSLSALWSIPDIVLRTMQVYDHVKSVVHLKLVRQPVDDDKLSRVRRIVKDLEDWEEANNDISDEPTRSPWFLLPCGPVGMDLVVVRQSAREINDGDIVDPPDLMRLSYSDDNERFSEWDIGSSFSDFFSNGYSAYSTAGSSSAVVQSDYGSVFSFPATKSRRLHGRDAVFDDETDASVKSFRNRVFVVGVQFASPAYEAEFKEGDEIVECMGDSITSIRQMYYTIMSCPSVGVNVRRLESPFEKHRRLQNERLQKKMREDVSVLTPTDAEAAANEPENFLCYAKIDEKGRLVLACADNNEESGIAVSFADIQKEIKNILSCAGDEHILSCTEFRRDIRRLLRRSGCINDLEAVITEIKLDSLLDKNLDNTLDDEEDNEEDGSATDSSEFEPVSDSDGEEENIGLLVETSCKMIDAVTTNNYVDLPQGDVLDPILETGITISVYGSDDSTVEDSITPSKEDTTAERYAVSRTPSKAGYGVSSVGEKVSASPTSVVDSASINIDSRSKKPSGAGSDDEGDEDAMEEKIAVNPTSATRYASINAELGGADTLTPPRTGNEIRENLSNPAEDDAHVASPTGSTNPVLVKGRNCQRRVRFTGVRDKYYVEGEDDLSIDSSSSLDCSDDPKSRVAPSREIETVVNDKYYIEGEDDVIIITSDTSRPSLVCDSQTSLQSLIASSYPYFAERQVDIHESAYVTKSAAVESAAHRNVESAVIRDKYYIEGEEDVSVASSNDPAFADSPYSRNATEHEQMQERMAGNDTRMTPCSADDKMPCKRGAEREEDRYDPPQSRDVARLQGDMKDGKMRSTECAPRNSSRGEIGTVDRECIEPVSVDSSNLICFCRQDALDYCGQPITEPPCKAVTASSGSDRVNTTGKDAASSASCNREHTDYSYFGDADTHLVDDNMENATAEGASCNRGRRHASYAGNADLFSVVGIREVATGNVDTSSSAADCDRASTMVDDAEGNVDASSSLLNCDRGKTTMEDAVDNIDAGTSAENFPSGNSTTETTAGNAEPATSPTESDRGNTSVEYSAYDIHPETSSSECDRGNTKAEDNVHHGASLANCDRGNTPVGVAADNVEVTDSLKNDAMLSGDSASLSTSSEKSCSVQADLADNTGVATDSTTQRSGSPVIVESADRDGKATITSSIVSDKSRTTSKVAKDVCDPIAPASVNQETHSTADVRPFVACNDDPRRLKFTPCTVIYYATREKSEVESEVIFGISDVAGAVDGVAGPSQELHTNNDVPPMALIAKSLQRVVKSGLESLLGNVGVSSVFGRPLHNVQDQPEVVQETDRDQVLDRKDQSALPGENKPAVDTEAGCMPTKPPCVEDTVASTSPQQSRPATEPPACVKVNPTCVSDVEVQDVQNSSEEPCLDGAKSHDLTFGSPGSTELSPPDNSGGGSSQKLEESNTSLKRENTSTQAELQPRKKWLTIRTRVQALHETLLDALDRNVELENEVADISCDAASFVSELEEKHDSVKRLNDHAEELLSEIELAIANNSELEKDLEKASSERDQLAAQLTMKSQQMMEVLYGSNVESAPKNNLKDLESENWALENDVTKAKSEKKRLQEALDSVLTTDEDLERCVEALTAQLEVATRNANEKFLERELTSIESSNSSLEREVSKMTQKFQELEKELMVKKGEKKQRPKRTNGSWRKRVEGKKMFEDACEQEIKSMQARIRELEETVRSLSVGGH